MSTEQDTDETLLVSLIKEREEMKVDEVDDEYVTHGGEG